MSLFRKFLASAAIMGLLVAPASAQILQGQAEPNPINLLINGNFNIAQQGTANVGTITTAAKYLQDQWAGYSGTSTQLTLSNVTTSLPSGTGTPVFQNAAKLQRDSGQTGVVLSCLVQEIEGANIIPVAGQPVALSFWALAGSNFSASSSNLTVKITTGTGADEGLASLITGWTGAATTTLNTTQAITTGWQRYAFTGTIPAAATEAAVQICWTPVGTASTNDYIQVTGAQLQRGTVATNFEVRPSAHELAYAQRYFVQFNETASTSTQIATCMEVSSVSGRCVIPLPVQMRAAPTTVCTIGTLALIASGGSTALSAFAVTTSASTVNTAACTTTIASGGTAGQAAILVSGNSTGGGLISVSARF